MVNHSFVHSFKEKGKTVWKFLYTPNEWYEKDCPKLVKVILTVAHLDHDETNHDVKDERLKALCQLCHLSYDAEWFKNLCQRPHKERLVISGALIASELDRLIEIEKRKNT